ncbi:MAG TPA: energy transducer TonB [Chthoniobacterales bacterium]|nr:energy transducer TonB [Chthoniobacterales bacterium]
MKNQALIYDRPSKWPIATALGTAVLIHLSAVAIAFHRDSPAAEPTGTIDFVPFGFEPADDPPIPPDPDMSLPPPPPPPTVDFIEPHKIEPSVNSHRTAARIRAAGQTRLPANGDAKAWAVSTPRPDYPYEARSRHLTGSGIAIISVDPHHGVRHRCDHGAKLGNPILDNSTVSAFRRWHFKPGSPSRVRIPITFLLTGAQY